MIGELIDRLRDELRRIWCYRWLALGVGAAVMIAAAIYVATIPNTYEAWGQIYVNQQTPLTAAADGVSLVGENYGSPYFVQKTLLNDDSLSAVVRRLDISDQAMSQDQLTGAMASLRGGIRVVDGGDGFLEIHFTDEDPARAQQVVSLLLDQFISSNVTRSQNDLRRAGAFLDEQIASYAAMISQSQRELAAFRGRHPGAAYGDASQGADGTMTELVSAPASGAAPAPSPSAAAERVAKLQQDVDSLLTTYTERHPDVVAARRQLADATRQLSREPPRSAPSRGRQSQVRRVVRRPPAPMAPEAAAQLAELRRQDEMLRTTYQQLITRRAAAQMSQDVYGGDRGGKYQITRRPVIPADPVAPDRRFYLLVGAVVAVAAGLGAAYLRGAMRGILISAREVETFIQLPVIATVSAEPAWRQRIPSPASDDSPGHRPGKFPRLLFKP